jgi:hypothetical protein
MGKKGYRTKQLAGIIPLARSISGTLSSKM